LILRWLQSWNVIQSSVKSVGNTGFKQQQP
jgi:hypothetical protein